MIITLERCLFLGRKVEHGETRLNKPCGKPQMPSPQQATHLRLAETTSHSLTPLTNPCLTRAPPPAPYKCRPAHRSYHWQSHSRFRQPKASSRRPSIPIVITNELGEVPLPRTANPRRCDGPAPPCMMSSARNVCTFVMTRRGERGASHSAEKL